jgi:hypothetical protein
MVTVSILTGIASLIIGTNAQTCVLNKYYCGTELLNQGTSIQFSFRHQ